VPHPS